MWNKTDLVFNVNLKLGFCGLLATIMQFVDLEMNKLNCCFLLSA